MSAPRSSGYVDVGALEIYYERHGTGRPLVLLHGAFGTIDSCFAALLPRLARHFEVIAVELQGHGHTRDIDRPLTYEDMAGDTAALLEALDISRAHFVGYSMGGAVGLQLAIERPELVDHLVYAGGASFDSKGVYPELLAGFESFDPRELDGTRWHHAYRRVAPDPDAWTSLVVKVNELDRAGESWPRDQIAGLQAPTLLINGDADIVRLEHAVKMLRLLERMGGRRAREETSGTAWLAGVPALFPAGRLEAGAAGTTAALPTPRRRRRGSAGASRSEP